MSSAIYRYTALHQWVDRAIRFELGKRIPDALRLFRLRRFRAAVKSRLRGLARIPFRGAVPA